MQGLATTFEDRTFCYEQVERQGMVALYRQTHKASAITRYEVITIQVRPAHTWPNGAHTPEHEAYPGSEAWGRYGHTFYAHASAQNHFNALLARRASVIGEDHQEKDA